ncbi:MAG: hypothetical protein ACOYOU_13535 [Kiritimatiellia bacterium]
MKNLVSSTCTVPGGACRAIIGCGMQAHARGLLLLGLIISCGRIGLA